MLLDSLLRRHWLGIGLAAAMTRLTPVPEAGPPWYRPGYGLGLMGEAGGTRGVFYGHNGSGPGYSTSAYCFPGRGITVAVIAACERPEAVMEAALQLHDLAAGP